MYRRHGVGSGRGSERRLELSRREWMSTAPKNMTLTCDRCAGDGYLTAMDGDHARAVVCKHLASCPDCRGTSYRPTVDEDGYESVERCPCDLLAISHRVQLYNEAGIPARFHGAKVHEYRYENRPGNQFRFRTLFSELCDDFEPGAAGIGLSGRPGVGKSHLMTALARYYALERGIPVRYTEFSRLLASLRAGYHAGKSEAELIDPLVSVDVLFIDEMGKGKGSEWELSVLDSIISERYNRQVSTYFSTNFPYERTSASAGFNEAADLQTNMPQEALSERLSGRIWSRLQEMCRLETVIGPDARKSQGAGLQEVAVPRRRPSAPLQAFRSGGVSEPAGVGGGQRTRS